MSLLRIRLCDADRAAYGVDGELVLDFEQLKDLTEEELTDVDQTLEVPVAFYLPLLDRPTPSPAARVTRVAVWLAMRQTGLGVDWDKCQPRPLRTEVSWEGDPGPPAGPSEASSEDAAVDNSPAK